jgi:hypothetical protein
MTRYLFYLRAYLKLVIFFRTKFATHCSLFLNIVPLTVEALVTASGKFVHPAHIARMFLLRQLRDISNFDVFVTEEIMF